MSAKADVPVSAFWRGHAYKRDSVKSSFLGDSSFGVVGCEHLPDFEVGEARATTLNGHLSLCMPWRKNISVGKGGTAPGVPPPGYNRPLSQDVVSRKGRGSPTYWSATCRLMLPFKERNFFNLVYGSFLKGSRRMNISVLFSKMTGI